jgi:hypothetical protein
MANLQEKLASSLQVLKEYQDQNGVEIIQGMSALGKTHTQRLINNGYLEQIVRGWYVPTFPCSNGRTARFVMNAMLTTSGLPWTIIPTEKRDEYMQALEVASVEGQHSSICQIDTNDYQFISIIK